MSRATCSYCYNYGHNKMGCPKAKKHASDPERGDGIFSPLQQWDLHCDETGTNRNSPSSMDNITRRKFDWDWRTEKAVNIQIAKRYRSRKVKRCNYCNWTGHNRRTCEGIKFHKALIHKANTTWRRAVASKLNALGLGVGAVFKGTTKEWNDSQGQYDYNSQIGLVVGIDLRTFNLFNEGLAGDAINNSKIRIKFNNGKVVHKNVPKCFASELGPLLSCEYWDDNNLELIAPAAFKTTEAWLNNEDIAKHIDSVFRDKEISACSYNHATLLKRWSGSDVEIEYKKVKENT